MKIRYLFSSLYIKLVLVLFLLFSIIGGIFLGVVMYSAPMYQQEVNQQLNWDLAKYIVNEHVLIEEGQVQQDSLARLFQNVMIINPSLELYLLDAGGQVIGHSMAPDKVKRKQVSLAPVKSFLANRNNGLIMGDDPGDENRENSFSVAPIDIDNKRQGYIYAILGSEKINSITDVLQRSLIMRWSTGVVVTASIFAFLTGLALFYILMRKLRVLSNAMQDFKDGNLVERIATSDSDNNSLDEIDTMTVAYQEMAQRIQMQMSRLQDMESQRRDMIANVSHDLRTPLSSLSGFLETLQLKSTELNETEKQTYLKIACQNAQRLTTLVEELFELAKLDANEVKPQHESFSMAELAYDVAHKFYLRAREKSIVFDVVADETVPYVSADVGMIERVLENLIDNALKHTPDLGHIRLHLSRIQEEVEVAVSDTGYGIAREELPHILKRFYRKADKSENGDIKSGIGLGLAIASRIVELHGSYLSVDSVLHQGTIFKFSLPAND